MNHVFYNNRLFQVSGGLSFGRRLTTATVYRQKDQSYQFVVCGAGAGGLAVASILGRRFGPDKLAIIDPEEVGMHVVHHTIFSAKSFLQKHYNQPMFTLIGGGLKTLDQACRPMSSLIPSQAKWLKTAVAGFNPEENCVLTSDGEKIGYDYLIVALGMQMNFREVYAIYLPFSLPCVLLKLIV